MDNLFAEPLIVKYIKKIQGELVIVSPDAGGVKVQTIICSCAWKHTETDIVMSESQVYCR